MSPYTFGGILLAFIAYSGAMVYGGMKYEGYKAAEADARHDYAQQAITVAAQQHVIATVQTQNAITQKTETDYAKQILTIDGLYSPDSVRPATAATGNGVCAVAKPASGARAPVCAAASREYKLTFKQCDIEEAKFNALWNDWQRQAAAK